MITISHNNKEANSNLEDFELNIPNAPLPYVNPVTQLFPELLKYGKFSYDNVINYYALIMHWVIKILIILTSVLMDNYLNQIILLSCAEFWMVKNYSAKYLIGLRWYINRNDIGDIFYLEKTNKLYPQNKVGIYFYWYSDYIFILLLVVMMIYKLYCQFYSESIILLFPLISSLINIFMYFNVIDGCEQEIYKYLEALTEYRMRRTIVCTFKLSYLPKFRILF